MKDWLSIIIPLVLVAGGFVLQTYMLQGRVARLEDDWEVKGTEVQKNVSELKDRVLTLELTCCED